MKQKEKIIGEAYVWLSSLGLSLGILMVLGLLSLIVVRGLEVFWPKPVALLALQDGQEVLGEVVLKQEKRLQDTEEWQMFVGNKEVLGQSFRFVDVHQIQKESYPPEVLNIERREYGDAFGWPVKLVLKDKEYLPSNESFAKQLAQAKKSSLERWEKIEELEKDQIGKLNKKMESLRLEKKQIDPKEITNIKALEEKEALLQKKYETLASQARQLRDLQEEGYLELKNTKGSLQKIKVSQIVDYYYPNQLTTGDRLQRFFYQLGAYLSEDPREANTEGGIFPALFGTAVMTLLMTLIVVPIGVLGAVYLQEYAKPGILVRLVRIAVNNLAGVPSIVFGVFGVGFFVYMIGGTIDELFFSNKLPTPTFGTGGLLWASLTLALLTVPVVIVSTEEALSSVSQGIREGSLALGASKWQTLKRVILPAAAPGILTGTILAMARGAGEVAPLMLVGVVKLAPTLPINGTFPFIHLDQKFMHLGFHIYDLGFQSPDSEAAKPMVFATTLLLILLVLFLNLGAIWLRERLRKKYASARF
ncbi:MAG: phosphate ABC transporter permease PstA [Deltaproteobacteria bacterium]|nr:phosphate ABC transporter permease PstA [Deltaproteobacteria bacterium]